MLASAALKVPFFDMSAEVAAVRPGLDAAIARVLDSGVFVGGPEVAAFERELAASVRCAHVAATSSGTDALLATFMALGIGAGDEIVTTPFTFFATAESALRVGARVVFADIDPETLTLDPQAAASRCTDRTRAVVPVHLFGCPAELPAVPCAIVEDAAQSLGASPVRGTAATTSFFPTKNLGALGDGGAVLTNDEEIADRIRLLRDHGARPRYHHIAIGGNFRLDALQAAVLRTKLPLLAAATAARRANAARYRSLFAAAGVPSELRLPPDRHEHVFHQFVIRAPRRDALRAFLARSGVETQVYYPAPLHLCAAGLREGYQPGAFPAAEAAASDVLALPIYPHLPPEAQETVVAQIAAYYRR